MGNKAKVKNKNDYKLLKCPFSLIKDNCIADECVSWEFTDKSNIYGHCILIQDK